MRILTLCCLSGALALFTACDSGGDKDTEQTDDTEDTEHTEDTDDTEDTEVNTSDTEEVDPCETAWADVAEDDKGTWMYACVMPTMTEVFQEHDSDRFKDFSCSNCHANSAEGDFAQPSNPHTLSWSESGEWPEGYSSFMGETVGPTMAGLLGYEPYDSKTGEGFGCADCHVFE